MHHMEELTTAEIAVRMGCTERTVQRWIKAGKLPALPLAGHRYAVTPSDMKHLALPEHVSETGEIVLEAMKLQVPLEEKLEDLRYTVDDLRERLHEAESKIERLSYRLDQILKATKDNAGSKKKSTTTGRKKKRPKLRRGEILLSSILPLDLTSLAAFAELHGIPWSAVTKAIKDYELFPERGTWRDGYRTVKVAIDERGMRSFGSVRSVRTSGGRWN